uniref:Uncharacterized protein n=1 Tax=Pseudictyota dubia TaxID=2749911 RepID=A0A7R9WE31_9STRA
MVNTTIPVSVLRSDDILLLLAIGAIYEIIIRTVAQRVKARSLDERNLRSQLHQLKYETTQSRRLGPSAFVETSKLERAVLVKEKDLSKFEEDRNKRIDTVQRLSWNFTVALNLIVFAVYYGVPILSVDGGAVTGAGDEVMTEEAAAASYMRGLIFPLSYIGVGLRLAGVGLAARASSLGALVVMWSAQSTVEKVSECVEALVLQ